MNGPTLRDQCINYGTAIFRFGFSETHFPDESCLPNRPPRTEGESLTETPDSLDPRGNHTRKRPGNFCGKIESSPTHDGVALPSNSLHGRTASAISRKGHLFKSIFLQGQLSNQYLDTNNTLALRSGHSYCFGTLNTNILTFNTEYMYVR